MHKHSDAFIMLVIRPSNGARHASVTRTCDLLEEDMDNSFTSPIVATIILSKNVFVSVCVCVCVCVCVRACVRA